MDWVFQGTGKVSPIKGQIDGVAELGKKLLDL